MKAKIFISRVQAVIEIVMLVSVAFLILLSFLSNITILGIDLLFLRKAALLSIALYTVFTLLEDYLNHRIMRIGNYN